MNVLCLSDSRDPSHEGYLYYLLQEMGTEEHGIEQRPFEESPSFATLLGDSGTIPEVTDIDVFI